LSLCGDIDGISDIEDVGSWDILSNSGLVVDGLNAWLFSGLGDGLDNNLLFLLGAINFDGDEVVVEDNLWNSDTDGSLGNDWGDGSAMSTNETDVSTEAGSSIVATGATTVSTVVVTMIRVI
jgi:hypothetical protein